jgi:hypothetical protein
MLLGGFRYEALAVLDQVEAASPKFRNTERVMYARALREMISNR